MKATMEVTVKFMIPLNSVNYSDADKTVKEWTPEKMLEFEKKQLLDPFMVAEVSNNYEMDFKLVP